MNCYKYQIMQFLKNISILIVLIFLIGCQPIKNTDAKDEISSGYSIEPVDIQNVKITDKFWLPIIKRVQEETIEYAIEKCTEEATVLK